MTKQMPKSRDIAWAVVPLGRLAELDDGEMRRAAVTDPIPPLPFPVDPEWYDKYWYGDAPSSRWSFPLNELHRLYRAVPHVGETMSLTIARTMSVLVHLAGTIRKLSTSSTAPWLRRNLESPTRRSSRLRALGQLLSFHTPSCNAFDRGSS